jgi:uncharacterized protein YbjT (DUF2867 family)
MTITQATSAPLIAVVGATGAQGKSVIKALTESNKPYRIRGFTRDATKPAAQALKDQGVELVAVNLVVDNKDAVYRAFAGADYAFVGTKIPSVFLGSPDLAGHQLLGARRHAEGQCLYCISPTLCLNYRRKYRRASC